MTRLGGSPNSIPFGLGGSSGNFNSYVLRDPWANSQNLISDIGNGTGGRVSISFGAVGNISYSIVRNGVSSSVYSAGTLIGSNNSSSGTVPTTSQPFCIGGGLADNGWFNSFISEIVIYNYALPTTQRQQIEGYLAWKWGLQAQLPPSHPHKAAAP